ncbi:unnamed protein product [Staurois parvus]|uniref:Uncharacterized protein n=1 Tax=Staurois parvus TaxID=386267 RepID=A0ABN9HJ55_9NEOB|nr:unnamed protein product [Staurois parvus]
MHASGLITRHTAIKQAELRGETASIAKYFCYIFKSLYSFFIRVWHYKPLHTCYVCKQGRTDNSWGPWAIGDHGAPVSLPKLKKAYEKGTRGISWAHY